MDRPDLGVPTFAHVVDGRLDVFGRRTQGEKDRVGILGLVLGDQTVVTTGEPAELFVGFFQKLQDRFGEVVAAGDHSLHVVLLILHRTKEHWIGQINHARDAATLGTEQEPLAFGRAVDDVFRRSEEFSNQCRFVLVERSLQMRCQEPIHDVHAGCETQLVHAPQDQRLVGRLLRILAEEHGPAGVQGPVDVVVSAVHVQRMLRQGTCCHLEYHRRALARRVIVLLDAVHDTLA